MRWPTRTSRPAGRRDGTREAALLAAETGSARRRLARAERVLVLTGAGISVGAGLPTFRGAGGLYEDGIPAFLHAESMPDLLPELWDWHDGLRRRVRESEPATAHTTLAAWVAHRRAAGAAVTLVTTNLDDLHERGGTEGVEHLHGRAFADVCLDTTCGARRHDGGTATTTPCPACGGPMRPDVVLFGEQVDIDALWAAKRAVRTCDLFLAVGTSASVYPASGLARYARDVGAFTVVVNPDPAAGEGFDEHVALDADTALPLVLATR